MLTALLLCRRLLCGWQPNYFGLLHCPCPQVLLLLPPRPLWLPLLREHSHESSAEFAHEFC